MNDIADRYPKTVDCKGAEIGLKLMTAADETAVSEFAKTLEPHDLLFLRRDITVPKVMGAWAEEVEAGTIVSLLAHTGYDIVGCSAVVCDPHSWSPHLGELRVLVSPAMREKGLGRILIQESFVIALSLGLEKLSAHMTVDQVNAIAVFEDMGFRTEALLRDQVKDRGGEKHDIAILSNDLNRSAAEAEAYGLDRQF